MRAKRACRVWSIGLRNRPLAKAQGIAKGAAQRCTSRSERRHNGRRIGDSGEVQDPQDERELGHVHRPARIALTSQPVRMEQCPYIALALLSDCVLAYSADEA